MRAFFLLLLVVGVAVADEAVKVDQPAVLEHGGWEVRTAEKDAEAVKLEQLAMLEHGGLEVRTAEKDAEAVKPEQPAVLEHGGLEVRTAEKDAEPVNVEQPPMLEHEGQEVRIEERYTEAGEEGQDYEEMASGAGAVYIGERRAFPTVPAYPYPYSTYYWPHVPHVAPSQLLRSVVKGVLAALPYYPDAYSYPYYTPIMAAPPVPLPAPPVGASVYYGNSQYSKDYHYSDYK